MSVNLEPKPSTLVNDVAEPSISANGALKRSILVTGCSSGIGLVCARGLKSRGWRVLATARTADDLRMLTTVGLEPIPLELADPNSVAACAETVLDATDGKLDAVFNNAAYGQPGAVEDLSRETLYQQFNVNVLGTHDLSCRLLPAMRARGRGRIVMNSSVLGFVSMPFRGAYNASKYALEGLCDTWRLELKGSGVYVSMIEPGPILSRFRQNAHTAFKANIDIETSVHRQHYQTMEAKFLTEGPVMPFTLEPEAVLVKLEQALNARRPKARYPVTVPTVLFAWLKRVLPDRALDAILRRA